VTPALRLLPLIALALAAGCTDTPDKAAASGNSSRPKAADPAATAASPVAAQDPAPLPVAPAATRPLVAAAPVEAEPALDLPASNITPAADPFPDEVTAFMVDRDGCDHFRGEEPYDEERRAYLDQSIYELCTGTDARLASLRKRYAANEAVIDALSGYEDRIEGQPRAALKEEPESELF
jgi:hypothetical protein